jgi:hypothetical protein
MCFDTRYYITTAIRRAVSAGLAVVNVLDAICYLVAAIIITTFAAFVLSDLGTDIPAVDIVVFFAIWISLYLAREGLERLAEITSPQSDLLTVATRETGDSQLLTPEQRPLLEHSSIRSTGEPAHG